MKMTSVRVATFLVSGLTSIVWAAAPADTYDKASKQTTTRPEGSLSGQTQQFTSSSSEWQATATQPASSVQSGRSEGVRKAGEIMKAKVRASDGTELGQIDDLAIDSHRGQVAYAVLARGGVLGVGAKLYIIPWTAFRAAPGSDLAFTLNTDAKRLEHMQAVDRTDWPDMSNPDWARWVHRQFGERPYWEPAAQRDQRSAWESESHLRTSSDQDRWRDGHNEPGYDRMHRSDRETWREDRAFSDRQRGSGDARNYARDDTWSDDRRGFDRDRDDRRWEADRRGAERRDAQDWRGIDDRRGQDGRREFDRRDREGMSWSDSDRDDRGGYRHEDRWERQQGEYGRSWREDGATADHMRDRDSDRRGPDPFWDQGQNPRRADSDRDENWSRDREGPSDRRYRTDQNRGRLKLMRPSIQRVSQIIGLEVRNPRGSDLGDIEDIMIELPHGRIVYAVLSFGGFMGIGDKLFAIPWESLQHDEDASRFVLDVPRSRLERAPGFEKSNWPDLADARTMTDIYEYYGIGSDWILHGRQIRGEPISTTQPAEAFDRNRAYNDKFDASTVESVSGQIVSTARQSPMARASYVVTLTVRTDDGRTRTVHLGPPSFVNRELSDLAPGQRVTIRGSRVTLDGQETIMATEISSDGKTVQLRSSDGTPAWTGGSLDHSRQR